MWQVPETLNITVTLFKVASAKPGGRSHAGQVTTSLSPQEPTAEEFEDKDWTFNIEDVSWVLRAAAVAFSGVASFRTCLHPPRRSPGAAPRCWRPLTST